MKANNIKDYLSLFSFWERKRVQYRSKEDRILRDLRISVLIHGYESHNIRKSLNIIRCELGRAERFVASSSGVLGTANPTLKHPYADVMSTPTRKALEALKKGTFCADSERMNEIWFDMYVAYNTNLRSPCTAEALLPYVMFEASVHALAVHFDLSDPTRVLPLARVG